MGWKIDDRRREALHEETGALYALRGGPGVGVPEEFELVPPTGSRPLRAELARMTQEIRAALPAARAENQRRRELAALVESHAGGSTGRAASLISGASGNTVTARAVQSWLIGYSRPSSRSCPAWAVAALARQQTAPPPDNPAWRQSRSLYAYDRAGVEMADASIEADRRLEQKWRTRLAPDAAEAMIEMERYQKEYIRNSNAQLHEIRSALSESTSFEEFRRRALHRLDDLSAAEFHVRDTRRAIEEKDEEFRDDDGES